MTIIISDTIQIENHTKTQRELNGIEEVPKGT